MAEKAKKVIVANVNISSDSRESISKCMEEIAKIVRSETTFCKGECVSQVSGKISTAEFGLKITKVEEK